MPKNTAPCGQSISALKDRKKKLNKKLHTNVKTKKKTKTCKEKYTTPVLGAPHTVTSMSEIFNGMMNVMDHNMFKDFAVGLK